jgi:hypothetical protein
MLQKYQFYSGFGFVKAAFLGQLFTNEGPFLHKSRENFEN